MQQDGEVHKKVAMADVIQIVLNVLVDEKVPITTELPESGEARDYPKSLPVASVVSLHNEWHLRAGADQRHVTFQNIDELRQFIQAVSAQPSADLRDPGIVSPRGMKTVLGCVDAHRAEFIEFE
jgi:hypothetical protein